MGKDARECNSNLFNSKYLTMGANAITLYRGDSAEWAVTISDVDGVLYNISGCYGYFTIKKNESQTDASAVLEITGTIESEASGVMVFIATEAAVSGISPGNYVYDVELRGSDGLVSTVIKDWFTVINDVRKG